MQNYTCQSAPVVVAVPVAAVVRHPVIAHFLAPYNRPVVLGFLATLSLAAVVPAGWRTAHWISRSARPAMLYSAQSHKGSRLMKHSAVKHSAHFLEDLPIYRQPVTH